MNAPSEHLARQLAPRNYESVRRSDRPAFPSPALVDRALLAAAGLLFAVGLLLLCQLATMGL